MRDGRRRADRRRAGHRAARRQFLIAAYRSGAFAGDFAGGPDEPAHVVSALMIRAYLTEGLPAPPMAFAGEYYAHYPKVAIGHWPPLFHLLEALWMLTVGASRGALVTFVALVAAILPAAVFLAARRSAGDSPPLSRPRRWG